MKQVLSFLILLCLVGSFCVVSAFASKEISSEDLLAQVPDFAHTGKTENISTVSSGGIINRSVMSILFSRLTRDGLIPEEPKRFTKAPTQEQLAECPRVSAEDIEKTLVRLFGPEAKTRFGGCNGYSAYSHLHLTRLTDGSYAYYDYSYGGGDGPGAWTKYIRSETVGEDLVLYARFAYHSYAFWLCESVNGSKNLISVPEDYAKNSTVSFEKMLKVGSLDEYLPIYKHTFKPNGDGTYYWAQTELDTAGKEIPLSVFEEEEKYLQSLVATVPKEAYRGSVTNPNYQSHAKLTYSMLIEEEDTLFVYESYAEWNSAGITLTLYSPRGNGAIDGKKILGTWENIASDEKVAELEDLIRDGAFVEYYTNYQHVFKKNDAGTYTWVKTAVNRYGRDIPQSLISPFLKDASSGTNTASGTATDLPASDTGTKTDLPASGSETDLPTSDTQTNLPTESDPAGSSAPTDSGTAGDAESSPLWIYVTVGLAVAVAAALGIFFAVKKKKA